MASAVEGGVRWGANQQVVMVPPREGEYRNRGPTAGARLADLQRGHADEALGDELPRVAEVFHGRDFQIAPLAEHHPDRESGGPDGGGVVAERPIPNRDPRTLQDQPLEGLRRLRRPEPFARHLFYG